MWVKGYQGPINSGALTSAHTKLHLVPNKMNRKSTESVYRQKSINAAPSLGPVEVKRYVQPLTTNFASVNTSGTNLDLLGLIAQGLGYYQRTGRVIQIKRITVRGLLHGGQVNAASDDPYNEVRICIVQGNSGMTLSSATLSLHLPPDPRTCPGLTRLIGERRISLITPARDSTGYIPAVREVSFTLPMNLTIVYAGDGASPCSQQSLYMYVISDSGFVAHPGFVSGFVSIDFTDQ